MHKLSESLNYYQDFLKIEKDQNFKKTLIKHTISYLGVVLIFAIVKLHDLRQYKSQKLQESELAAAQFDHLKDSSTAKKQVKKPNWKELKAK